jgi:hypothetical protein
VVLDLCPGGLIYGGRGLGSTSSYVFTEAWETVALPSTTVLLFDLPALLGDILADALGDNPDFRVVRSPADVAGPMAVARRDGASVVIVASGEAEDLATIDPALCQTAAISMLALGDGGTRACLHTFRAHTAPVSDVSIAEVMAILTAVAERGGA